MAEMKRTIAGKTLELVQGDITKQQVDAIGNAANSGLRGGGGVDGAIHRAGGPRIMKECRAIGGCPTGQTVATTGGELPVRRVLHSVGPIWRGGKNGEAEQLASCYRTALALARDENLASVAFPSISTGIYGYPLDQAAGIAIDAIAGFLLVNEMPTLVRMVLFDAATYQAYADALKKLPE